MKLNLTKGQLEKLSDLSMDVAKALLVSAVAVPIFEHAIPPLITLLSIISGLTFVILSLKLEALKENKK